MGKDNIVGRSLIMGAIEGFVISTLDSIGGAVKVHAADYLKSNVLNIGTNDEELYLLARAYCLEKGWATIDELTKVREVIDSYEPSQRKRIIGMIGKREGEGSIVSDKLDNDGKQKFDSKTKEPLKETTSFKTNVAGAKILQMLAKMTKDQIKEELDSSGASNSMINNLKKIASQVTTAIETSQVKQDGDARFARETWLDRVARAAREKRTTI